MSIQICQVLDRPTLARVRAAISKGNWQPVSGTPSLLFDVSFDRHLWRGAISLRRALNHLLLHELKSNSKVQSYSFGRRLSPFGWLGLSIGQKVIPHIESPLKEGSQTRADIACILCLSDEKEYQGGAISIRYNGWQRCVRLGPGMAVLYPVGALLEIQAVKEGRLCLAKNHVQSWVPNAAHRYVLQLLGASQRELKADPRCLVSLDRINVAYKRLLHEWSSS
ncbi:hypothetical protein [Pseudoteredinibacter isoporae]|uniref:Putative 2-oxoglutarate/Fe(II)-dependent dioxygenase YbiX n=1 Tax=Pseudoteredinibacter isoporae TaxID=570281 RepID=A0A7X0JTD9_9GAMM|nr:hypothetical protein [Pseudoteredinibacter isoporae]MBB6521889.1 putative 2-oxoglutarate/Fe(II)-dependent dioxygenase YbiX [Pseudoteredinibacter isoporae]NHO87433.1 hypothetical protein [Pseudoteredinibacter isoporae]NIB24236.1 hypothetical protein [Pseudoteredinibacter isoporae]